jgi:hypothetical protein
VRRPEIKGQRTAVRGRKPAQKSELINQKLLRPVPLKLASISVNQRSPIFLPPIFLPLIFLSSHLPVIPSSCHPVRPCLAPRRHGSASAIDPNSDYDGLLVGISDLLEQARRSSARAINHIMTATYWEIGRRIVEYEQGGKARAVYGERLLDQLSVDLTTRHGRGFSARNLRQMRTFYSGWQIWQTPSAKFEARARFPLVEGGPDEAIFQTPSGKPQLVPMASQLPGKTGNRDDSTCPRNAGGDERTNAKGWKDVDAILSRAATKFHPGRTRIPRCPRAKVAGTGEEDLRRGWRSQRTTALTLTLTLSRRARGRRSEDRG